MVIEHEVDLDWIQNLSTKFSLSLIGSRKK